MKKHITKREFQAHGWRKGDRVRTERGIECARVVSLVTHNIWTGLRGVYWHEILEIIPKEKHQ